MQQWREIPFCCGMLVWHEALGRQMCLLSCPCILRCPSLNHLVHLLLSWLQMRQNLRHWDTSSPRYQGELVTCSGSHGASCDSRNHCLGLNKMYFDGHHPEKSPLFWSRPGLSKITNDDAQIRPILWRYNASVFAGIFGIERDFFFGSLMLLMFLAIQWIKLQLALW